ITTACSLFQPRYWSIISPQLMKFSQACPRKDALRNPAPLRINPVASLKHSGSRRSRPALEDGSSQALLQPHMGRSAYDRSVNRRSTFALFANARRGARATRRPPGGRTNEIAAGRAGLRDTIAAGGAEYP